MPRRTEPTHRGNMIRAVMVHPAWDRRGASRYLLMQMAAAVDDDSIAVPDVLAFASRYRVRLTTVLAWFRRWQREGILTAVPGRPDAVRLLLLEKR